MRWFVLSFFIINNLTAEGISDEALGPIYTEALWFVGVIAVMAVISFVVSSRNAKRHAEKMALEKHQEKVEVREDEAVETSIPSSAILEEDASSVDRLLELSKLHKEGLLSEAEFMVFKKQLYRELEAMHVNLR